MIPVTMRGRPLTSADLDAAVKTLWGECRGEPRLGQVAVAWIIRRRAEWDELHGEHAEREWWGVDVASVCLHPWQFSCWLPSDPNAAKLAALDLGEPLCVKLRAVVEDVFIGDAPDPTGGATHYKVRGTRAMWDHDKAGVARVPSASIGAHDFFAIGPTG